MSAEHKPVPVEVAMKISEGYEKDVVVILAWQKSSGLLHTTTFGKTPDDKIASAKLGDLLTQTAGGNLAESVTWEDFRVKPAAVAKEHIDRAMRLLGEAVAILKNARVPGLSNLTIEVDQLRGEVAKSYQMDIVSTPEEVSK